MQGLVNAEIDKWIRPWEVESFDNLLNRDERFFSLVIKGMLSWLNSHLQMYGKPIRHFIFNTGSSYMYIEDNGYDYSVSETNGEDWMYMETPRCLVNVGSFTIPTEELTAPYVRGVYERISNAKGKEGQIVGYNAEMHRLPVEFTVTLKYVFSNFNEALIFVQELFETVLFQQYFNIIYLGQIIKCSLEIDSDSNIEFPNVDLTSKESNMRTMEFNVKVCTNLPIINTSTECECSKVIAKIDNSINFFNKEIDNRNSDPQLAVKRIE